MKHKKQILSVTASVLLSVFLVATAVYGVTTVGDNVTVGGTLTVTGAITHSATTTFNGAVTTTQAVTFGGNVTLGDAAGDTITVTGVPTFAVTSTFTGAVTGTVAIFTGDVWLGSAAGDTVIVGGDIAAGQLSIGLTATSSAAMDGDDVYITGELEVDATSSFDGKVAIGAGGTKISKHLSVSTSTNLGVVATSCESTSTYVAGAASGDTVVASPTPATNGVEDYNLSWNAYASSTADFVEIQVCPSFIWDPGIATSTGNVAKQTWRIDVWKH